MMDRHQISPFLQSEVLTLGRELETASLKMEPAAVSSRTPRRYSLRAQRREKRDVSAPHIRAFTLALKLALDRFRGNALPLYPISPIEAALLPLGMISNSSCDLFWFLEWILKSERVMEYRIGAVHTVQHNSQRGRYGVGVFSVILVGLENRRGIQNWLKIQQTGPDRQGTVTLATTKEALDKGDLRPYVESRDNFRIGEDTLPVTRFAREMTDLWVLR
ncbi:hypothetical protein BS47DRAFT_244981 [Hydnum rufescens UP504]|uniref:Uncharacterized protein n=1 Tax=Hydnum rufescens UP504 TaxID=1448309 RepID=A0A9P6ALT7_9AGAM|nr:hypothetical protein BS47DRAFT_244981 [Hydnum rufescens UP504]